MKTFVYTLQVGKAPRDGSGTKKTVRVWQIVRNKPEYIASLTDTFADGIQMVLQVLRTANKLPKKVEERYPNGMPRFTSAFTLKEYGIVDIYEL